MAKKTKKKFSGKITDMSLYTNNRGVVEENIGAYNEDGMY